MQKHIVDVAIIFASLCFFLYFVLTLAPLFAGNPDKAAGKLPPGVETIAPVPATVLPDLVNAFAALVEALAKAGPALWSLIGSLLFFLIGALAAGVFS